MTRSPRRDAGTFDRELIAAAVGQFVVLAAIWAGVGLGPVGWFAGVVFATVTGTLLAMGAPRRRAAASGSANRVTLARATLVGGVTALVTDGAATGGLGGPRIVVLLAVASVALVMDLLDGWVARRTGTESALGARFDMEVDAFLILVLAAQVSQSLGLWVLTLGFMRYAFVVTGWLLPWMRAPLPPSRARKVVAAVQGVVLAAAAAPVVPRPVAAVAVAAALASLVWSFGRDLWWLAFHAPDPTGGASTG